MLETDDDAPRFDDFVGVGGTQRDQAGNIPERGKLLHRLMRGSVLADANGIVREHIDDWQLHQGAQPDRRFHIVREDEEAGAEGDGSWTMQARSATAPIACSRMPKCMLRPPSVSASRSPAPSNKSRVFVDGERSAAPPISQG